MKGVIVEKYFTGNEWMSLAFKTENNKVWHGTGGVYKLEDGILSEDIDYSLNDQVGTKNKLKVKVFNNTLYQSGIVQPGTHDEYKIEEYWIRVK